MQEYYISNSDLVRCEALIRTVELEKLHHSSGTVVTVRCLLDRGRVGG